MYRIVKKDCLNPTVTRMEIEAPRIAKKAEPGQFIILRVDEESERIPLTIADFDREKGTITIIYQIVGATTKKLDSKKENEFNSNAYRGFEKSCGNRWWCRLCNSVSDSEKAS